MSKYLKLWKYIKEQKNPDYEVAGKYNIEIYTDATKYPKGTADEKLLQRNLDSCKVKIELICSVICAIIKQIHLEEAYKQSLLK